MLVGRWWTLPEVEDAGVIIWVAVELRNLEGWHFFSESLGGIEVFNAIFDENFYKILISS